MDQTYQFTAAQGFQQLSQGWDQALTVVNSGLISFQITDDPNGTSTGLALAPGSSIVWDPRRPLNAYVLPGTAGVALLVVLENSGTITNPSAIAAALLTAGLATAIGNAISITGAPPINAFTTVISGSIVTLGGSQSLAGSVDVSKFQSLDYYFRETKVGVSAGPPVPRQINFIWADGTIDTVWLTDNNGAGASGAAAHGSVPVRTPTVQVTLITNGVNGRTVNYNVTGSYRTVPAMLYRNGGGYFGVAVGTTVSGVDGDRFASVDFGTPGAVTSRLEYPPVIAGPAMLSWVFQLSAGTATFSVIDITSGVELFSLALVVATVRGNQPLMIPNRPVVLSLVTNAAAVTLYAHAALAYQT